MAASTTTLTTYLHSRTWGIGEPTHEIAVPIRYEPKKYDGYYVRRADTGAELGWVGKSSDGWYAYLSNVAYYPAGADLMTRTEHHPRHRAASWAEGELVSRGYRTRTEAAEELLFILIDRWAESLNDLAEAKRNAWFAEHSPKGPVFS